MTKLKVLRTIENPPALDINTLLYGLLYGNGNGKMPVHVRLEQRIVWNLLLVLETAGFNPHSVDDGDEVTPALSKKAAMELLFNLDDAYLFLSHESGEKSESEGSGKARKLRTVWIRFVFGNGVDVISDYNATNWNEFETVMDGFDPEVYA